MPAKIEKIFAAGRLDTKIHSDSTTKKEKWLGYFLGGCDGLLIALVVFVAVDYITGVMCAIADKKLSSAVGFRGICRKVLIFLLVGVAHIVDLHVVGSGSALRGAVVCFYLSNEGVSMLENRSAPRPAYP